MTSPISGAAGSPHPFQPSPVTPPAKPADPDHDGDVDGPAGDAPTASPGPSRGIDTLA